MEKYKSGNETEAIKDMIAIYEREAEAYAVPLGGSMGNCTDDFRFHIIGAKYDNELDIVFEPLRSIPEVRKVFLDKLRSKLPNTDTHTIIFSIAGEDRQLPFKNPLDSYTADHLHGHVNPKILASLADVT